MIGALVYRLTKGLSVKEIKDSIPFLREREVVHYQRFGEALDTLQSPIQPRTDVYLSGKKTKEKC